MSSYTHKWDQDDHLIQAWFVDSGSDTAKTVDFHYCRTCSGSRTEKIVKDEYGFVTEWLRYEMEGLNHLRIDERYDSPGDANSVIDDNDPWRVQRVYYNGPGQLGQIVKATVWEYTSTPTPTNYYYGYDILGNVSVISNNSGTEVDQFEQDAFGNEVESSWTSPAGGITEHLTTKQYDADLGLYYFNARWYDRITGGFLSFDPLGSIDENGQQIATYLFAKSNPMLYGDPTGLETCIFLARRRAYGIGWHWIYVEETNDGSRIFHRTADLLTDKDHNIPIGSPGRNRGIARTEVVEGPWNGISHDTRGTQGTFNFDHPPEHDLTGTTCKPCLLQGAGNAFTMWTNMPRGNAPWGNVYEFDRHNSNQYINCLLKVSCGDDPPVRLNVRGGTWFVKSGDLCPAFSR